jgi:energy-coupling factor transporter ATP-binding protein EcfA2
VRLQTFRIRYCFGFVDSDKIDLREPNSLVWILGRNSSGKSSVLRALEQLAPGKRPDEHPRFANFDPPPGDEYGSLEAEFSVAVGELSIRPVVQRVVDAFSGMPVEINEKDGQFTAPGRPDVEAVLKAVQEGYRALLSATEEAGRVRVIKDYDAEYWIVPVGDEGDELHDSRRRSIRDVLERGGRGSSANRPTNQWVMGNVSYPFALSFVDLEEAFYSQFPNVFLFPSRFALGNDLPQVVTEDFLNGEKNQVASGFVSVLDPGVVRRWLRTSKKMTPKTKSVHSTHEMASRAAEILPTASTIRVVATSDVVRITGSVRERRGWIAPWLKTKTFCGPSARFNPTARTSPCTSAVSKLLLGREVRRGRPRCPRR